MTEREKQLIDAYIPFPRDNTLGDFEYFVKDMNEKIQRVEITDILPCYDRDTVYLVVQVKTRKRVRGWGEYDGFTMSNLYDNKQDCKDETHLGYPYWEKLREIQRREAIL